MLSGKPFIRSRVRIDGTGGIIDSVLISPQAEGRLLFFHDSVAAWEAIKAFRDAGWEDWTKGGDFVAGTLIYEKVAWREDYSRGGILRLRFKLVGSELVLDAYQVVDEETREPDALGWQPPPASVRSRGAQSD